MISVKIENITKKFDQITAIHNLSLNIDKGEIIGLIGPDGAGKTTLLRLMIGLLKPNSGSIQIEGVDSVKNPQLVKDKIGYMPQHFSLYGDLSVSENMKFFADIYRGGSIFSRKNRTAPFFERKKELLEFSGLVPFEDRLARNLSGGMQKKLALACNLFHTPEILLLDEPTTGLDPVSRRELWNLLFQLNKQEVTLIITTPYMDEAQRCHRVGLMYEGKILSFQSPQSLIQGMKDEIIELVTDDKQTKKLLGNLPDLKAVYPYGGAFHLTFEQGKGGEEKTKEFLEKHSLSARSIKIIPPSFEDVFLNLINKMNSDTVTQ